jgi:hypothetical protein
VSRVTRRRPLGYKGRLKAVREGNKHLSEEAKVEGTNTDSKTLKRTRLKEMYMRDEKGIEKNKNSRQHKN